MWASCSHGRGPIINICSMQLQGPAAAEKLTEYLVLLGQSGLLRVLLVRHLLSLVSGLAERLCQLCQIGRRMRRNPPQNQSQMGSRLTAVCPLGRGPSVLRADGRLSSGLRAVCPPGRGPSVLWAEGRLSSGPRAVCPPGRRPSVLRAEGRLSSGPRAVCPPGRGPSVLWAEGRLSSGLRARLQESSVGKSSHPAELFTSNSHIINPDDSSSRPSVRPSVRPSAFTGSGPLAAPTRAQNGHTLRPATPPTSHAPMGTRCDQPRPQQATPPATPPTSHAPMGTRCDQPRPQQATPPWAHAATSHAPSHAPMGTHCDQPRPSATPQTSHTPNQPRPHGHTLRPATPLSHAPNQPRPQPATPPPPHALGLGVMMLTPSDFLFASADPPRVESSSENVKTVQTETCEVQEEQGDLSLLNMKHRRRLRNAPLLILQRDLEM
ncbi:Cell surface glycoprotein 1 [Merluccius polli]|uniref:Cell surface glycoprotein 1 n=1 Tax=Merluccius polli TaxID=89951 RepID=A0AA47M0V9_MERPO|nr:Cell surface glycoprotein 1 [Merluccius polli]